MTKLTCVFEACLEVFTRLFLQVVQTNDGLIKLYVIQILCDVLKYRYGVLPDSKPFICPGVVRCILYKESPRMDLSHTVQTINSASSSYGVSR